MTAYLVRHAKAGDRTKWKKRDEIRPLTKSGLRQAQWLVDALRGEPVGRILSSAYIRCAQTVEPLAQARVLEVELSDELAEGAGTQAMPLVEEGLRTDIVLCSHGDVLGELLDSLHRAGVPVDPSLCHKGSVWILRADGERFSSATYLKPPA